MGYMRYHAIIVTTYCRELLREAQDTAKEIFGKKIVTDMVVSAINEYSSFMVGPDGSKEGWHLSDEYNEKREAFVAWLQSKAYEDGSNPFKWAEVQYGDEGGDNKILSDERKPR